MIKAGRYVIIPDFGFYKGKTECYLEVVGFWTPEYLNKKIQKLKMAKCKKIIVAANKSLGCKSDDFNGDVILYSNRIPVMPIAKILKRIEEEEIEEERKRLDGKKMELKKDVVFLRDLAQELQVSEESLAYVEIPGYIIVGDRLVSLGLLERAKEQIGEEKSYDGAMRILEASKLGPLALDVMGYRTEWRGLEPVSVRRMG